MTIRIIDVVIADVDESVSSNHAVTSVFVPGEAEGTTGNLRYGSAHYQVKIAIDTDYHAYLAPGGGTYAGGDSTVGTPEQHPGYPRWPEGQNDLGYIFWWQIRDNWSGGLIPVWFTGTTMPYTTTDFRIDNRGGGNSNTPSGGQWVSKGNAWWWHGGSTNPDIALYNVPNINDPSWVNMNNWNLETPPSFDTGGNWRSNYYVMLTTNLTPLDTVKSTTGETRAEMVSAMKALGYYDIGEVIFVEDNGVTRGYIYVAASIIWCDTYHGHAEKRSVTLWDDDTHTSQTTLYWYCSVLQDGSCPSFRVEIPRFNEMVNADYYPWAIKKDAGWMSCNRTDAYLKIKANDDWRDCKNGGETDTVHQYDSEHTEWDVCPKIGLNAD